MESFPSWLEKALEEGFHFFVKWLLDLFFS
jgi:hypothetical protein